MNAKKTIQFNTLIALTIITIFVGLPAYAQQLQQYRLAADDEISISVFDEEDLSLEKTRIAADGSISMPLIGKVQVNGLTIDEVEAEITRLYLGDYLKKPNVTVAIVEYRQFYINGEVKKPGGYSFREGMTVERAITLAGGFTERASRNKIRLAKDGRSNESNPVKLDSPVMPGDVITVDESFF